MIQEIQTLLRKTTLPKELNDVFSKVKDAFLGDFGLASVKGTLYQKHTQCGTKGCHCARDKGHGPYYYLKGSTREYYIGKTLPENFVQKRYIYGELEKLVQLYGKILMRDSELTSLVRDFVFRSDSILDLQEES